MTNSETPVFLSRTGVLPDFLRDIALDGAYPYIANEDAGLRIGDANTLVAPIEAIFYPTPGYFPGFVVTSFHTFRFPVQGKVMRVYDPSRCRRIYG